MKEFMKRNDRSLYDIMSDLKKLKLSSKYGPLEQTVPFIELEAIALKEEIQVYMIRSFEGEVIMKDRKQVFDYLEKRVCIDRQYLKSSYVSENGEYYIVVDERLSVCEYLSSKGDID